MFRSQKPINTSNCFNLISKNPFNKDSQWDFSATRATVWPGKNCSRFGSWEIFGRNKEPVIANLQAKCQRSYTSKSSSGVTDDEGISVVVLDRQTEVHSSQVQSLKKVYLEIFCWSLSLLVGDLNLLHLLLRFCCIVAAESILPRTSKMWVEILDVLLKS